jgi:hypothetical protein
MLTTISGRIKALPGPSNAKESESNRSKPASKNKITTTRKEGKKRKNNGSGSQPPAAKVAKVVDKKSDTSGGVSAKAGEEAAVPVKNAEENGSLQEAHMGLVS